MPVPPLWFVVAASALVGVFLDPALALVGLGGTALFSAIVASNRRFQQIVDAPMVAPAPMADTRAQMLDQLDPKSRDRQAKLEKQCAELQKVLESANAGREHIAGVWQLAGLHLRLLVARMAAQSVSAGQDDKETGKAITAQMDDVKTRLAATDLDGDLREALTDQSKILEQRLAMQKEAARRLEVLDAELERIREQIALIREQALLASDPSAIARSVDSLATFLNESGKWLKDQEQIFGDLGDITSNPFESMPPAASPQWQQSSKRVGESQ